MTTAWIQLGEVYTHLLPFGGSPDSLADLAFTQARRLDTTAASVLVHPIEIRLRRGDTLGVAPMLRQLVAAQPDSDLVNPVLIASECVRRGAAAADWKSHVAHHPLATLVAAKNLVGGGAQLECAVAGFTAILATDSTANEEAAGRRYTALVGLQAALNASGNSVAAERAIDAFIARWDAGASLFLLGAPLYPALASRARAVASADSARWGAGYASSPYNLRLWELGQFAISDGRADRAAAVRAVLDVRDSQTDSTGVRTLAASMRAFLLLTRGDSVGAMTAFTKLILERRRTGGDQWDEVATLGAERLALARILLARHEDQQAIDVASVFDSGSPLIYVEYLPASLDIRAQAAKSLGNPALAAHYLARLTALKRAGQVAGG